MKSYRRPHQIKRKKSILKNRFFWSSIFILAVLGTGFYFFIFSELFQVKEIIVQGAEKVFAENIESAVKEGLGKKILFFNTKSIFLVNMAQIRDNILQKFPQVEKLEIKKRFPDVLNLTLEERKETGIFCRDALCFLLDSQGVIFEKFSAEELPLLKIQNLLFNKEIRLGEKAVEKEILSLILEIESKLKEDLKILIAEALIASEDRLNVKTSEGWEIYFSLKEDISWQLTKLILVLEKEIPPEKRGNLEYIDLRFSRVYYKYR